MDRLLMDRLVDIVRLRNGNLAHISTGKGVTVVIIMMPNGNYEVVVDSYGGEAEAIVCQEYWKDKLDGGVFRIPFKRKRSMSEVGKLT